ncbi:uncharacterized protein LOC122511911 [Leptopilina heterotoma]|uniref:uncharacterized protein LOC122511911 n=1 Tax=Leptopilina heterotoma TaxID=63436 RepID=UPI001CA9D01F|nr:uncharacterized protein LOC122511911 [Leptopilina heterotoma]
MDKANPSEESKNDFNELNKLISKIISKIKEILQFGSNFKTQITNSPSFKNISNMQKIITTVDEVQTEHNNLENYRIIKHESGKFLNKFKRIINYDEIKKNLNEIDKNVNKLREMESNRNKVHSDNAKAISSSSYESTTENQLKDWKNGNSITSETNSDDVTTISPSSNDSTTEKEYYFNQDCKNCYDVCVNCDSSSLESYKSSSSEECYEYSDEKSQTLECS